MNDQEALAVHLRAKSYARGDRNRIAGLVRLRRYAGATQASVAALMGVDAAWVASFERYDNDPRLSEIRRYQNAVETLIERADGAR